MELEEKIAARIAEEYERNGMGPFSFTVPVERSQGFETRVVCSGRTDMTDSRGRIVSAGCPWQTEHIEDCHPFVTVRSCWVYILDSFNDEIPSTLRPDTLKTSYKAEDMITAIMEAR